MLGGDVPVSCNSVTLYYYSFEVRKVMIIHDNNQLHNPFCNLQYLTTHTTTLSSSSESGSQFRDPGLIVIQP